MSRTVTVRYFAVLRERRGLSQESWTTESDTVGALINELLATHRLGLPPALIRAAVGQNFVEPDTPVIDGMDLVLIPPVAGG